MLGVDNTVLASRDMSMHSPVPKQGPSAAAKEEAARQVALEAEAVQRLQREIQVLETEKQMLLQHQEQTEAERVRKEREMKSEGDNKARMYQINQKEKQRQLRDLKIKLAMKEEMLQDLARANDDVKLLNQQYIFCTVWLDVSGLCLVVWVFVVPHRTLFNASAKCPMPHHGQPLFVSTHFLGY